AATAMVPAPASSTASAAILRAFIEGLLSLRFHSGGRSVKASPSLGAAGAAVRRKTNHSAAVALAQRAGEDEVGGGLADAAERSIEPVDLERQDRPVVSAGAGQTNDPAVHDRVEPDLGLGPVSFQAPRPRL